MQKLRRCVFAFLKHGAIGMGWWLALIALAAALIGPTELGRVLGVAWLRTVKFPADPQLEEMDRSVVVKPYITWVEYEHRAWGMGTDATAAVLEKAMGRAGYAKRDEERKIADPEHPARHWLLFTRGPDAHSCFMALLTAQRDGPTTITMIRTVYKLYSETAYERFKEADEYLGGALSGEGQLPGGLPEPGAATSGTMRLRGASGSGG